MSWLIGGIKGALGMGQGGKQEEAAGAGDQQEDKPMTLKERMELLKQPPETLGTFEAGKEEEEVPAVYPDDLPWSEDPCLHCENPCSAHKQIPDYLKIDTDSPLCGSIKPYRRHVLFQTPGQHWNNWKGHLDEGEGTLAAELSVGAKAAGERLGYRVVVTAVDAQPEQGGVALPSPCPWLGADEVLVLPDLVALGPITVANAQGAIEEYLASGQATSGVAARPLGAWAPAAPTAAGDEAQGSAAAGATAEPASGPLAACVLVCAHKLRDKRCGVAGPMIMEELGEACKRRGLQDKVSVLGCSHIGGHKFAGNLIVYNAAGGHWYGRVKPCHAEAIVDTHIVQGQIVKELWRGCMDQGEEEPRKEGAVIEA